LNKFNPVAHAGAGEVFGKENRLFASVSVLTKLQKQILMKVFLPLWIQTSYRDFSTKKIKTNAR